jgi:amino acid transporter
MGVAMSASSATSQHLSRSLGLWDLVFIGIILVQPTAPMPLYGVVQNEARGHAVTTILIAMVAMLFTAISYGRMARAYPSAGSAYTYVGQELHSSLGYATGWSMLMDYVLNPVICTIWCAKAAQNIWPLPYVLWAAFFAALFTMMNLRRIRATARINAILTAVMSVVIVAMLVCTVRYVMGLPNLNAAFFTRPFYDPQTFTFQRIATGTSLAVLTYIGFDGISTLSEEVRNPRRNILIATVLICLIIGVLSAVEVYAAQLVQPATQRFSEQDVESAYAYVAGRAGGLWLFHAINLTLIVATIGSGAGAQLSGARLLYGMGRDNAIPKRLFGALDPRKNIPANNVILIGAISFGAALLITYETGAALLNFGALIGFMGVNISAFVHYFVRSKEKHWSHLAPPLAGFVICLGIWLSLQTPAKIVGGIWLAFGIVYGAWKTQGFRRSIQFEAPAE